MSRPMLKDIYNSAAANVKDKFERTAIAGVTSFIGTSLLTSNPAVGALAAAVLTAGCVLYDGTKGASKKLRNNP